MTAPAPTKQKSPEQRRQALYAKGEKAIKEKPRLPGPPPPDLDRRLAHVVRWVEPILAQKEQRVETHRFVTLVDVLASNKLIPAELQMAADRFRELYLKAMGPSQGVSSYGEYTQSSPPFQRTLTTDSKLRARDEFMAAFRAAFGVDTNEGRWIIDKQLMKLVIPALLSDYKEITQAEIGRERTRYSGRAQVAAVGAAVILEVLNRLCLHFGYKTE